MHQKNWEAEELIENWTLIPTELELVRNKVGGNQIGFALLLKYFQQTLLDLVKEYKSTGTAYRQRVHTVMRSSFASHYRRMIPQLLEVLEFRSNNDIHKQDLRVKWQQ